MSGAIARHNNNQRLILHAVPARKGPRCHVLVSVLFTRVFGLQYWLFGNSTHNTGACMHAFGSFSEAGAAYPGHHNAIYTKAS